MKLWLQGVLLLVQCGASAALSLFPLRKEVRNAAGGMMIALMLCRALPLTASLCARPIIACAFLLGMVLARFFREQRHNGGFFSMVLLFFLYGLLAGEGVLPVLPLWISPLLFCQSFRKDKMFWLLLPLALGWLAGGLPLADKDAGLLLTIGCGLLCGQSNPRLSGLSCGIAAGVIISL